MKTVEAVISRAEICNFINNLDPGATIILATRFGDVKIDPHSLKAAIQKRTIDKCFCPHKSCTWHKHCWSVIFAHFPKYCNLHILGEV